MVTVVNEVIDEYCPGNTIESSDDTCSSGVDESVVNGNNPSGSSEECMDVTPSRKAVTPLSSSTPRRPNGVTKRKSSTALNCSANVRSCDVM